VRAVEKSRVLGRVLIKRRGVLCHSSFLPRLARFRLHDDGAGVGVAVVSARFWPDAITLHPAIK
jgi:hypothetical protein